MARTCVMATVTRVLAELTVATAISTVACRKLYQLRKSGALPAPEPRRARETETETETVASASASNARWRRCISVCWEDTS